MSASVETQHRAQQSYHDSSEDSSVQASLQYSRIMLEHTRRQYQLATHSSERRSSGSAGHSSLSTSSSTGSSVSSGSSGESPS